MIGVCGETEGFLFILNFFHLGIVGEKSVRFVWGVTRGGRGVAGDFFEKWTLVGSGVVVGVAKDYASESGACDVDSV